MLIKKLILSTLSSALLLSTFSAVPSVSADDFNDAIDEQRSIIEETDNQVHNLEETISSLQEQVRNAEDELKTLDRDITANEDKINEVVERLEAAHAEMKELQDEITELEDIIAKRTEQLENQARKIQVDGQTTSYIEFIIEAESLTDIIGRIDIVSSLVSSNRKLVRAQVRDMEAVAEKQERTEQTIVQQNALGAELEVISQDLEQQRLEKEVLVAQIAAERATAQSDRDRYLSQRAEAEQAVSQLIVAREEAEQAAREAEEQRRAEAEQREQEEREAAARAEEQAAEEEVEVSLSSSQSSEPESSNSNNSANQNSTSAPNNSGNTGGSNNNSPSDSGNNSGNNSGSNSGNNGGGNGSGGSSNESSNKPAPAPQPSPAPAPSGGTSWATLQPHATRLLGTRYQLGGSTESALDCSGFTSLVFRQVGISLPRTAAGQYASSRKISRSDAQPGDLIFFSENGSTISHVGIYVGGGRFIGSQTSTGVAYANAHTGYWGARFVGYGRY